MDYIFYHNNCPDGFCAAFIAKKRYPEAKLVGLNHGEQGVADRLVEMVRHKDALMVDFSLRTRAENVDLHDAAKSFLILDHHKTALAELEGLEFAIFDMNRSGAAITWDTLFGTIDLSLINNPHIDPIDIGGGRRFTGMPEVLRPWYVDYVQDRDLWNHALPNTKEVNAFLMTLPFTLEAWRTLDTLTAKQAAEKGEGAVAHVNHYVREVVEQRQTGKYLGYTVAVVNAPYLNISEVGNVLAAHYAQIGLGWFERGDGIVQFSLRSVGDIDVSAIAKSMNGGGHRNAAGFQLSLSAARLFLDTVLGRS